MKKKLIYNCITALEKVAFKQPHSEGGAEAALGDGGMYFPAQGCFFFQKKAEQIPPDPPLGKGGMLRIPPLPKGGI